MVEMTEKRMVVDNLVGVGGKRILGIEEVESDCRLSTGGWIFRTKLWERDRGFK